MPSSAWLILVISGGLALWLLRRPGKTKVPRVTYEAPPRPIKAKREMTPDELEVERAREAFEQNDRKRDVARHRHAENTAAARGIVEQARKYVMDSGLDKAVPSLWENVQHWGSWIGMPDRWQPPEGIAKVGGGGDREYRFASWSWAGRHYRIGLTHRPNYTPDGDSRFGDIDVTIDGEQVLVLACIQSGYDGGYQWRMSAVDMIKVGPWMSDFIHCAGHIRLMIDQDSWRKFALHDQERANRINLGNNDV